MVAAAIAAASLGFSVWLQTAIVCCTGPSLGVVTVAETASGHTKAIEKVVFSSEELPAHLDARAGYALRRESYRAEAGIR